MEATPRNRRPKRRAATSALVTGGGDKSRKPRRVSVQAAELQNDSQNHDGDVIMEDLNVSSAQKTTQRRRSSARLKRRRVPTEDEATAKPQTISADERSKRRRVTVTDEDIQTAVTKAACSSLSSAVAPRADKPIKQRVVSTRRSSLRVSEALVCADDNKTRESTEAEVVDVVSASVATKERPKLQRRSSYTEHNHTVVALHAPSLIWMALLELSLVVISILKGFSLDTRTCLWLAIAPVFLCALPLITGLHIPFISKRNPTHRMFPHVIPPLHIPAHEPHDDSVLAEITLRDFLLHQDGFHLGLAPAFFGFYAYFGALTAWEEHVPTGDNQSCLDSQILSVAGASAGAMSAVLLAAGIPPRRAAEFCQSVKLSTFADPPGIGAAFKGDLFEELMQKFMEQEKPGHSLQLQDGKIPVAVSAFDIKTMKERLLKNGSMAKAARSSATFPLLFQPCQWSDKNKNNTAWFIDGGVTDMCGLNGLSVSHPHHTKRIVNLVVGGFPPGGAPGPSKMPSGITASEVLSISIRNTPQCGPWAMQNGPRAHEAARRAMIAALDLPLYKGKEAGHYELHLDAGCFVDK